MRPGSIISLFFLSVIVAGCSENETSQTVARDPENIYFDYVITGEETGEFVTCKFQYRMGGPEGDALELHDSIKVELDGERIQPDSSRFSGIYYEAVKPLNDFKGRHTIVFTSPNGKKYQEDFEFIPFSLETPLPPVINRKELVIRLKDFPSDRTPLRIVLTDTAFGTSWVNKHVAVTNGELKISTQMLARLKNGPIGLELHYETERKPRHTTRAGGRIVITYSLKRELELAD